MNVWLLLLITLIFPLMPFALKAIEFFVDKKADRKAKQDKEY